MQSIMSSQAKSRRIIIDSNHPLASLRKFNGIPSYAAKGIDDDVAAASFGDVFGDRLRGDGEPAGVVEEEGETIVLREEEMALIPVWRVRWQIGLNAMQVDLLQPDRPEVVLEGLTFNEVGRKVRGRGVTLD